MQSENVNAPDEARRQMIGFYLKFYITYIIAVTLSDIVFTNWFIIVIVSGILWVPQIIRNVRMKTKNEPNLFYCLSVSFSQAFMP